MALEAEQLSTMSDAEIRDSAVIENDEIEIQSQLHNGAEAVQESPVEQQQLFVQERDLLDGKVVGEPQRIEQGINGKASVVELEGGVRRMQSHAKGIKNSVINVEWFKHKITP